MELLGVDEVVITHYIVLNPYLGYTSICNMYIEHMEDDGLKKDAFMLNFMLILSGYFTYF
jgi:hypothetical protein